MRTRRSPMLSVRQNAFPVSPACSVRGTLAQSVTVNGNSGIFIVGSCRRAANSKSPPSRKYRRASVRREKIFALANHTANSIDALSSLNEGRLLETSLKMERGVAARDAARNRSSGGTGIRPPGTTTRAARSLAARAAEAMPQTEARTRSPKTATVERREASVLRHWTQGASQAPGMRRHRVPDGVSSAHSVRLSALRPPLKGGNLFHDPGASAPRERSVLFARAV